MNPPSTFDSLIKNLLREIPQTWVTKLCCDDRPIRGSIRATEENILLAGVELSIALLHAIDPKIQILEKTPEGRLVHKDSSVLKLSGPLHSLLKAEALVLSILGRLSTIADQTQKLVHLLEPYETQLIDGHRFTHEFKSLDRQASILGGAKSRRLFFKDCIRVERNHIKASGSITTCVNRLSESLSPTSKIEVQCQNLSEIHEALDSGVHLAILPPLSLSELEMAVRSVRKRMRIEVTGFLSEREILQIAQKGVDFVSTDMLPFGKWIEFQLDLDF